QYYTSSDVPSRHAKTAACNPRSAHPEGDVVSAHPPWPPRTPRDSKRSTTSRRSLEHRYGRGKLDCEPMGSEQKDGARTVLTESSVDPDGRDDYAY
ncbi:hypothetical protein BHE74_00048346, partial [Ensete ventricosum]